jgi:thiamine-phosphate diphosphorylase / hydroxyethylthiazole kinase
MDRHGVDYSLYLVTDSTPAILGDRDLCEVVEAALRGGVTCVQYREKKADTGDMVATARRLHELTRRFQVPLLINDRVDVALAIGCEGVHIGQDDIGESLHVRTSYSGPTWSQVRENEAYVDVGAGIEIESSGKEYGRRERRVYS